MIRTTKQTFERWDLNGTGAKLEEHSVSSVSGGGIGIDREGNLLISIARFTQDVLRHPATGRAAGNMVHRKTSTGESSNPPGGLNFKSKAEN